MPEEIPMRYLLLLAALVAAPAFAREQTDYLDDRSSAEAVVSSYYNAIDRKEYARAYSYFGAGAAPAYDAWVEGYADTDSVAVSFGEMAQEGAAGSIYYTLPVTLDVERTDGSSAQFSGCYTLRLAQPLNQEPPFEGIHIEDAKLHEAEGASFAPAKCD
jgi:hypothetical protein